MCIYRLSLYIHTVILYIYICICSWGDLPSSNINELASQSRPSHSGLVASEKRGQRGRSCCWLLQTHQASPTRIDVATPSVVNNVYCVYIIVRILYVHHMCIVCLLCVILYVYVCHAFYISYLQTTAIADIVHWRNPTTKSVLTYRGYEANDIAWIQKPYDSWRALLIAKT